MTGSPLSSGTSPPPGTARAASGATPAELAAMARAIELAALGLGATSPNPVVGCVVLDEAGAVVGEGYHAAAGSPHAEVVALRAAGARAVGGTVVVTLEPCSHTGRTGPCTEALRAAGVARVVYAVADPTPVAAGGAEALRAAGIEVLGGVAATEAKRGNEAWLFAQRRGRPFLTWKFAASLDGQVAAADGSSQWITSAAARADVHRLRAQSDAVLAGIGTVLADDPALTARPDGPPPARQPLRVVVDSAGRTPPNARVLTEDAATVLAVAADAPPDRLDALRRSPAEVTVLPRGDGGLDPTALLAALHARDVRSVFLEGGPTLAGSFLRAGLIDRVIGYLAPVLLGSGRWPALRGGPGDSIATVPRLRLDEVTRIGPDARLTARFDRADDRDDEEV
jgi:diaminohydroxyphosphoribosylaminopyrimidine deaminase / 5-amino-6-(5-phosphoribosylamino)uracil reductase